MPSPGGIRAARAFVEMGIDDTALQKGLKSARRKLGNFSRSVATAGAGLLAAGTAINTPLAASVQQFAKFETSLAKVLTLVDDASAVSRQYGDELRRLSIRFGENAETLAEGLFQIISASIPAEKSLMVLNKAAELATAGFTTTGIAADALTTVLNAYGKSADEAGQVSDVLFQIAKRGKTDFEKVAGSIGKVATLAATLNVPLEDLGAAFSTITRAGINTEEAFTALGATIQSFLNPAVAKNAKELGFDVSRTALESKGLLGVLQDLQGLPPDVLARIFPERRALAKGILPLLNNLQGFEKDIKGLTKAAGSTDKAFQLVADTTAQAFASLTEAARVAVSVVGETLRGEYIVYFKLLTDIVKKATEWVKQNKGLVSSLSQLGVGLTLAGGALLVIAGAAKAAFIGLGVLGAVIAALTSPLGVMFSLVGGLGALFVTQTQIGIEAFDRLKRAFKPLLEVAKETFSGIAAAMTQGDISLAAEILWAEIKLQWRKGLAALDQVQREAGNILVDWFYAGERAAISAFAGIQTAWELLVNGMYQVAMNPIGFLSKQLKDLAATLTYLAAQASGDEGLQEAALDQITKNREEYEDGLTEAQKKEQAAHAERLRNIESEKQSRLAASREVQKGYDAASKASDDAAIALARREIDKLQARRKALITQAVATDAWEKLVGTVIEAVKGPLDVIKDFTASLFGEDERETTNCNPRFQQPDFSKRAADIVRGTFSSLRLSALGVGTQASENKMIADATAKTAKGIDALNRTVKRTLDAVEGVSFEFAE